MLLKELTIINDLSFLAEANIVNAGSEEILIKDVDGNTVEHIHTFDKILDRYLSSEVFNARTTPDVKKYFDSNFKKWIKIGAPDRSDDMMDEKLFRKMFYVPIDEYIDEILHHESALAKEGKLSKEIILNSFPEFVRKNPADAVVFSGGRLFRLKKLKAHIEKLHEYLLAVVQNAKERNDTLMPPQLMASNISVLQVPEAFKRTDAWHRYTEQQAEKISLEQAKHLIKELKPGEDFEVIDKIGDDLTVVKLKTAKCADVEGKVMKHCVASYGRDIEKGKTVIWSVRTSDGMPVATIEMRGNTANQVKGPHNTTIKTIYHDAIRKFFKKHKISVGADAKNIGGMKESPSDETN